MITEGNQKTHDSSTHDRSLKYRLEWWGGEGKHVGMNTAASSCTHHNAATEGRLSEETLKGGVGLQLGAGWGPAAHLFIMLLVSAHGCQLLFFHNLHEALLQALAHQHLQQWLHLCQSSHLPSSYWCQVRPDEEEQTKLVMCMVMKKSGLKGNLPCWTLTSSSWLGMHSPQLCTDHFFSFYLFCYT